MAKWRFKLNLKDAWKKAQNDEITTQELVDVIAKEIERVIPATDNEAMEIREQFESLSTEAEVKVEWFDDVMAQLYDWGDTQVGGKGFFDAEKMCWIATNF